MHTDSRLPVVHDCRYLFHFKSKQQHLNDHICIRILIIKMLIFRIVQKCLPAKSLESCRRITDMTSRRHFDHLAEQRICQFFGHGNRKIRTPLHKPRSKHDIRISSICILLPESLINLWNIADIMLPIRIHLYHIFVFSSYCIFISKLQCTAITKVKHMRN